MRALTGANIRLQRKRAGLSQQMVAARMRVLGHGWRFQTLGMVERAERVLYADELEALALCLETTVDVLRLPPANITEVMFGEHLVPAQRLVVLTDSVSWDGDQIRIGPASQIYRQADLRVVVAAVREALQQEQGEEDR